MSNREALTVSRDVRALAADANIGRPVDVVREPEVPTCFVSQRQDNATESLGRPDDVANRRSFSNLRFRTQLQCELLDGEFVSRVAIEARYPVRDALETNSFHPVVSHKIVGRYGLDRLSGRVRVRPQPRAGGDGVRQWRAQEIRLAVQGMRESFEQLGVRRNAAILQSRNHVVAFDVELAGKLDLTQVAGKPESANASSDSRCVEHKGPSYWSGMLSVA